MLPHRVEKDHRLADMEQAKIMKHHLLRVELFESDSQRRKYASEPPLTVKGVHFCFLGGADALLGGALSCNGGSFTNIGVQIISYLIILTDASELHSHFHY